MVHDVLVSGGSDHREVLSRHMAAFFSSHCTHGAAGGGRCASRASTAAAAAAAAGRLVSLLMYVVMKLNIPSCYDLLLICLDIVFVTIC